MPPSEAVGYLPGDPRYGLSGDKLRRYYSEKPAQWVIFAWDGAAQDGAAGDGAAGDGQATGEVDVAQALRAALRKLSRA